MTLDIVLVLTVLGIALILFIGERIRMDLVSLMVLSALALLGLVTPAQAVSGFSNAAVVTVWAMFILSEGLTRAGVAEIISRNILRVADRGEARMIVVIMLTAGMLSGFMNNIGVAALMMPVVVDIARRTKLSPSRLLMPMAYGSLLGGLTTLVGTPPNLLISGAMRDAGLRPFSLFDFTPIGVIILLAGTAFVALVGRHLLPRRDLLDQPRGQAALYAQYELRARTFALRVPNDSVLVGKSIYESGLASPAGLIIIALTRSGRTEALPAPTTRLQGGDVLLAQGRQDRFDALRQWSEISIEREAPVLQNLLSGQIEVREVQLPSDSKLVGRPLQHREFHKKYRANVLAVRRAGQVRRTRLGELSLAAGDHLLVQCTPEAIKALNVPGEFDTVAKVTPAELDEIYRLKDRVFVMRVPAESALAGVTMSESRLGDAFDFRLLAIFRDGELKPMPEPDDEVEGGDLVIIQGREEDLDVLRGLQQLVVLSDVSPDPGLYDSGHLDIVEATLHPRSTLAGKSVGELALRENHEIQLVAIWRRNKPYRSDLDEMILGLGDALLFVGPRTKLAALSTNPEFIVVSPAAAPVVDSRKAPLAGMLMLAVAGSVVAGWLPISIAAIAGATLMVLTRCLSMEQAYRAIDWRAIFLIAGMLPLGIAMQETGAAEYIARAGMASLGEYGPWPVIAGLYGLTAVATMIIPTAALVVLMAPIVLSASASLGIAPDTAMMAVAIAASASFTSPISHPANVMVMGPGGYRFMDYLKIGVPLTLVVFLVAALVLPVFWPLR